MRLPSRMKFSEAVKKAVNMLDSEDFAQRVEEEDPTMKKQIPLLKEINKSGFLTFDSQAGRGSKGLHYQTKEPYEIKERAYIMGFMLEERAVKFIKIMGLETDKNVMYVPLCKDSLYIPKELDIPLTISIQKKTVTVSTHMSAAMPKTTGEFLKKMVHLNKSEKAFLVFCWDPLWNRLASGKKGLFTELASVLKDL